MPTYEYTCKSCGTNLEVFQSFSDKPLKKCPECGGELQKIFHARGVVFKGSGFYATDSRGASSTSNSDDTGNGASKKTPEKAKPKKESEKAGSKTAD